ncbi:MAG: hypothetical protein IJE43_21705 [Alphaproteobacteria bacterium]|nr:hypothetical protein [Alphaproteobacteria bacterium]
MQNIKSHIIVLDGKVNSGRKTFCFELALALMYNNQKTALLLSPDSSLHKTLANRPKDLPTPEIILRKDFLSKANDYDAIIIPEISSNDELAITAQTYITMQTKSKQSSKEFQKNLTYINSLWELKKKIASKYNRSLDWVICENNLKEKAEENPSEEILKISRMYGFRLCPPLNKRNAYQNNFLGLSAQDKTSSKLNKYLTYDDICAKREIIKLAEFIFS